MADDDVADMKGTESQDMPTAAEGQPSVNEAKVETENAEEDLGKENVAAPEAGGEEE